MIDKDKPSPVEDLGTTELTQEQILAMFEADRRKANAKLLELVLTTPRPEHAGVLPLLWYDLTIFLLEARITDLDNITAAFGEVTTHFTKRQSAPPAPVSEDVLELTDAINAFLKVKDVTPASTFLKEAAEEAAQPEGDKP